MNTITGGAGDDVITGAGAADRINVGSGTDTVVYTALTDTLNSTAVFTSAVTVTSADIITGFGNNDKVDLSALDMDISVTSVGTALATALTADALNLVRGTYNGSTFTTGTSATDNDWFLEIVETTGTDTTAGVVFVDVGTVVTASWNGTTEILTFIV